MKLRKWFKLFLLLLFLLGICSIIYFCFLKKDNNGETITDKQYKTLELMRDSDYYNSNYIDEYKDIVYKDDDSFLENISILLDKEYSAKEINNIMTMSDKNIEKILKKDYIDVSNYYKIKNFDADKIDRYNKYAKNTDYSLQDVVTYVNINLDLKPYEETNQVSDPSDLLALVNKYNGLPTTYKPDDLAYVDGFYNNQVPMRKVAKESFLELQNAAKENGINLMPTTAYRDASFQKTLYNNYVAKDGVEAADTYSARPGFSDHQTGLAIDLKDATITSDVRLSDEDFEWLEKNCAEYGFIIRYPKDKENITLYQFENWHIRYVGKEEAKTIMDNHLTLEEYIDLYVLEY